MAGPHHAIADPWGLRAAAVALAGMAGAALQMQQPVLWPTAGYLALFGVVACGLAVARFAVAARTWALALTLATALFAVTGLRAGVRLADQLPAALEGRDIVVAGVVAGLPRQSADGVRFTFDVEGATYDGRPAVLPPRISLGWYRGWNEDALISAPFEALRAGQRWRFTVRLKQPHGALNPHGFDFELWLFEQGIRATGDVRATAKAPAERLSDAAAQPV